MAGTAAVVGGIDWLGRAGSAWNWGQHAATSAQALLVGLPRDCRLAAQHAAMLCLGQDPQYYTVPGFGPFVAAWGWFFAGIALGAALAVLFAALTGNLRREPAINTLAAVANPGAADAERARQEVLTFLASGGRPALRDLASATGMSEQDFIGTLLGAQTANGAIARGVYRF